MQVSFLNFNNSAFGKRSQKIWIVPFYQQSTKSFFSCIKKKTKTKNQKHYPEIVYSCLNNLQTFHWKGSINNKVHLGEAIADCFWIHNHKNLTGTTLMYWNIYLYMSLGCAYLLLFAAEPKVEGLGRHCEV